MTQIRGASTAHIGYVIHTLEQRLYRTRDRQQARAVRREIQSLKRGLATRGRMGR